MKREWLIDILNERSLTHKEAADLSGIERSYFTQIVNGNRRPSPEIAQRIAIELNFEWTLFFKQNCSDMYQKEEPLSPNDPKPAA